MDIEYCADVIAFSGSQLVLVRRLSEPLGLALVGGRQDPNELLSICAVRECKEETGLTLKITGTWKTYAEPNRDPRGPKVTTVFIGEAFGIPRGERNKTEVVMISANKIEELKDEFVCDHYKILKEYLSRR